MIKKLGVNRLKLIGFIDITYKDMRPSKYKDAMGKVRKLDDDSNERSKATKPSFTMDAEAVELMEITSEDIDTTVKDVEQKPYFI